MRVLKYITRLMRPLPHEAHPKGCISSNSHWREETLPYGIAYSCAEFQRYSFHEVSHAGGGGWVFSDVAA